MTARIAKVEAARLAEEEAARLSGEEAARLVEEKAVGEEATKQAEDEETMTAEKEAASQKVEKAAKTEEVAREGDLVNEELTEDNAVKNASEDTDEDDSNGWGDTSEDEKVEIDQNFDNQKKGTSQEDSFVAVRKLDETSSTTQHIEQEDSWSDVDEGEIFMKKKTVTPTGTSVTSPPASKGNSSDESWEIVGDVS